MVLWIMSENIARLEYHLSARHWYAQAACMHRLRRLWRVPTEAACQRSHSAPDLQKVSTCMHPRTRHIPCGGMRIYLCSWQVLALPGACSVLMSTLTLSRLIISRRPAAFEAFASAGLRAANDLAVCLQVHNCSLGASTAGQGEPFC